MMRRNDYLMKRDERDYRNAYGSEEGYVDSRMSRDYRGDMRQDMRGDMRGRDYRSDYNMGGSRMGMQRDSMDHNRYDYRQSDYAGYDRRGYEVYGSMRPMEYDYKAKEEEYEKDLKHWIKKMESKNKFHYSKDQVIQRAKEMNIKFDEFTEDEFYAAYLAMVTDYKKISDDFNAYISLAKDFLMDDDIAVSPSEKICIYMYEIVMGGKK